MPELNLTERDLQVLRLIAAGLTNTEIAAEVMLSKDTIKWYRKRLLVKFQAANSAELVYKASEMKII